MWALLLLVLSLIFIILSLFALYNVYSYQYSECVIFREKASDVVSVIQEAKDHLIIEPEQYLGGWAVIALDEKQLVSTKLAHYCY